MKEKYHVGKAYLFIGYIPENRKLYARLTEAGYILKFKPVLHLGQELKQGNVDADLALNIEKSGIIANIPPQCSSQATATSIRRPKYLKKKKEKTGGLF